jgi:hypothetical protein
MVWPNFMVEGCSLAKPSKSQKKLKKTLKIAKMSWWELSVNSLFGSSSTHYFSVEISISTQK